MAAKKKATASTAEAPEAAPKPKRSGGKKLKETSAAEAAPGAGVNVDLEEHLHALHANGVAALTTVGDGDRPAVIDTSVVVRAETDDAAAEEVASESPATVLSGVVDRALRFAVKEGTQQRIWLYPNVVRAHGPVGSIHIPWSSPKIPDSGVVVDGKGLKQKLRVAGPDAVVDFIDGKIVISYAGGSRKFSIKTFPFVDFPGLLVPDVQADEWTLVDPSTFLRALLFAGDDKIQPPVLSGVHVHKGSAVATDRRSMVLVPNFTDKTGIDVVLPRQAFDGISVDEKTGDMRCYFAVTANRHAVVGDPRTGEYRVAVCWGDYGADVHAVVSRVVVDFEMVIDKGDFVDVLKQMRLVQSPGSGVKLWMWVVPPPAGGAGHWLELRGGAGDNELSARLPARYVLPDGDVTPPGMADGSASFKLVLASDLLLKMCKQVRGNTVRIGFGGDDRSPVRLATHEFTVVAAPMVD